MFKRLAHITLALFLLVSTGGVTIYHHYCGNRLVSTTFDVTPKDCCGGMCKSCHTKSVMLQVKGKFLANQLSISFAPHQFNLPDFGFIPVNYYLTDNLSTSNPDPDIGVKPFLLKHLTAGNKEAFLQVFLS